MNAPRRQLRSSVLVFLALGVLLAVSAGLSRVLSGPVATAAGLGLASAKVFLIAAFFMRLRERAGLVRLAALTGMAWLAILLVLVLSDYRTRSWHTRPAGLAEGPALLPSGNSP